MCIHPGYSDAGRVGPAPRMGRGNAWFSGRFARKRPRTCPLRHSSKFKSHTPPTDAIVLAKHSGIIPAIQPPVLAFEFGSRPRPVILRTDNPSEREKCPSVAMADVDVQVQYTTTERKTRKVKKTSKRRESGQNAEGDVTVTEIEQTNTTATNDDGYVQRWPNSLDPRAVSDASVSVSPSVDYRSRVTFPMFTYARCIILATLTYPP